MNSNEQEFIMMCGLPGAGKSYAAERMNIPYGNYIIHSSDAIREEILGDINCQDKNNEVFKVLHDRVKRDLRDGKNVIYDATNIHSKYRASFLKEIKDIPCKKIALIVATPYEKCLRNNWMRSRRVPDEVVERMYKNWQTPYYFEGWDDIKVYSNEEIDYLDVIDRLGDYDQNNPFHSLSLGVHMVEVWKYLKKSGADEATKLAGVLHDIGKPFTRFEDDNGISHYYNHANVGAYDALSLYGMDLEVSALINYHMVPMNWMKSPKKEELIEKYKKLWGEDFVNKLLLIHEADKENA